MMLQSNVSFLVIGRGFEGETIYNYHHPTISQAMQRIASINRLDMDKVAMYVFVAVVQSKGQLYLDGMKIDRIASGSGCFC